jgi:hypothetical protein
MATQETCTWTGASGKQYLYYVFPRHPVINDGQDGNYVYAKKNLQGQWVPVYFGQGDLSKRATPDHHRIGCIDTKSATHVHLRLNATKTDRLAEEQDLLGHYTNAYAPHGCNVKLGG